MFFYLTPGKIRYLGAWLGWDWSGVTATWSKWSASVSLPRQICHAIKGLDSDDRVTFCVGRKAPVTCITRFLRFQKALRCRQECRHPCLRPSAQRSVVCVQPFLANCWFAGKLLYWSLQPISIGGVQFWGGPSGLLSCSVFSYKPYVSCQKNHLGREKALWFN